MSIEKVREYLKQFDKDGEILEFDVSSATVELAAAALGCAPELIAKTISLKLPDNTPVLIVATGDAKIDNRKYKDYFNTKAKMLQFDEVEELIGHAVGGVCPFAVNDGVKVYLDESLKRFEHIYPACGSSNSAIKLTPNELQQLSNPVDWIDVCKFA